MCVPHPEARPRPNVLDVLETLHEGRRYAERCPLCDALPTDPCVGTAFEIAMVRHGARWWYARVAHLFDPPLRPWTDELSSSDDE